MAQAIFAYNNGVNSRTGLTPLEGLFRWKRKGEMNEIIRDKLDKKKDNRADRVNQTRTYIYIL